MAISSFRDEFIQLDRTLHDSGRTTALGTMLTSFDWDEETHFAGQTC
jgi:hypothetical protein